MKCLIVKIVLTAVVIAALAPVATAQSAQSAPSATQSGAHATVPAPASSSLNLQLPASQNVPGASDPPGKYYGDTSGKKGKDADGSSTTVHGSVSTMVGYSKGYGTSNATGVNLDIDHQTDNGNHVGVQINMVQGRGFGGFGYPGGYGYRHGWNRSEPAPASSSSDGGD